MKRIKRIIKLLKKNEDKDYSKTITDTKSYFLTPCNVMAIGKVKEMKGGEYIQLLDLDKLTFKAINKDKSMEDVINYSGSMEYFKTPDNSKYSVRYLKQAKEISWSIKGTKTLTIYGGYDIKKREFIKDYPCMLRCDDLCFIIAPRIEKD